MGAKYLTNGWSDKGGSKAGDRQKNGQEGGDTKRKLVKKGKTGEVEGEKDDRKTDPKLSGEAGPTK